VWVWVWVWVWVSRRSKGIKEQGHIE
jgi:hypothetical protein